MAGLTGSLKNNYPPPPAHYFNQYTDDSVSRGKAPTPPPLPAKGDSFSVYGAPQWNDDYIVRPLESLNIKRLYPQTFDRKRELKKALHSVMATFLDLIDSLIKCPRSPKRNEKLEDVNLLFIHMQHLLNEYRVHQARDAIRSMLEVQRRQTLDLTDRLNFHVDKVTEIVASCAGTSTSEQTQRDLTSNLKWEIGRLQSSLIDLVKTREEKLPELKTSDPVDAALCGVTQQTLLVGETSLPANLLPDNDIISVRTTKDRDDVRWKPVKHTTSSSVLLADGRRYAPS